MQTFTAFGAAAAPWGNFYVVVGTAGATLVGLMFVAITFGATLVSVENAASVRSFIDPTFTHFVHVLVTACLVLVPSMSPTLLGVIFGVVALLRGWVLVRVYRDMHAAHRKHGDIELSDWVSGIVVPALCYLTLAFTGVAFALRWSVAFDVLAGVEIVLLLVGVFGAWELVLWLAITRNRKDL